VGELAIAISSAIGAPARDITSTGTSIIILDPQLGEDSLDAAGVGIAEAVLWNFWPRLMENAAGDKRISLSIEVEGKQLELPAPEVCPPLDL
ncbi:hypothetical protein ABTF70_18805, partial [Acinetobacter baumannii]